MSSVLDSRSENCSGVRRETGWPDAESRDVGKSVVWRGLFCVCFQISPSWPRLLRREAAERGGENSRCAL